MPDSATHLLWHLGHIAVIAENISEALGHGRQSPEGWWQMFGSGSHPEGIAESDWPQWSAVIEELERQEQRLCSYLAAASDENMQRPNPRPAGHRPDTVYGWIAHTVRHEALHAGIMRKMRSYLNHQASAV
jgi:hypothetical protein